MGIQLLSWWKTPDETDDWIARCYDYYQRSWNKKTWNDRNGNQMLLGVVMLCLFMMLIIPGGVGTCFPLLTLIMQVTLAEDIVLLITTFVVTRYPIGECKKVQKNVIRYVLRAMYTLHSSISRLIERNCQPQAVPAGTWRCCIAERENGERPPPPVRVNYIAQRGEHYVAACKEAGHARLAVTGGITPTT